MNRHARNDISSRSLHHLREESFGHLIRRAHRAFNKAMQVRLEGHDVTVGQWAFLRVLWEQDGLTQGELAEVLGLMEPSAMSVINGLYSRGLINRVQDPYDGRKRRIRLTRKGRSLKEELLPYASKVNNIALAGVDSDDAVRLIREVINNLERDITEYTGESD